MAIDDDIQQKLQQVAENSGVSLQVILRNASVLAATAFATTQPERLLQAMGAVGARFWRRGVKLVGADSTSISSSF